MFWGSITGRLRDPFVVSCYCDVSGSVKVCLAVFALEVAVIASGAFTHCLWTEFSVRPARDSEVLSDLLWVHLLHLLASSVAEFLSLHAFSESCSTPGGVLTLSVFPKEALKLKFVFSP